MSYHTRGCSDCCSFDFITNYREGDVTCRNCVLVQEERMVVDDIFHNPTTCEDHNIYDEELHFMTKTETDVKIQQIVGRSFNVPETVEQDASRILKDIRKLHTFRGQPLKAAVACSLYIAYNNQNVGSMCRDAKEIYEPLSIDAQVFNKTLRQICELMPD